MGWQEIATAAVVLVAVGYLVRRFRGKSGASRGSGGPDVPASRLNRKKR